MLGGGLLTGPLAGISGGIEITYWVIGGGGGAGRDDSFGTKFGGGGGGGIITSTVFVPSGETITATAIGAGGQYQTASSARGNPGGNTVLTSPTLGTLTAIGGGEGGGANSQAGGDGGSGGGGAGSGVGGAATPGQGSNGGDSAGGNWSAGGGGYSAAGSSVNGGAGLNIQFGSSTLMYSYGGGSRAGASGYYAGLNGDGTSADTGRNTANYNHEPGQGSGGRWQGGGGNSGSIIIRAPYPESTAGWSGTTHVQHGNYRYYKITSSGGYVTISAT